LQEKERAAEQAFRELQRVCTHSEGFYWNGFGSKDGSNYQCRICNMYKEIANRKKGNT